MRRLRAAFPDVPVVAHRETIDGGSLEAEMMAKAGATHVVVMARAREETIRCVVKVGRDFGCRSFAPVCDTGGVRRTWLREFESVSKRHLMVAAARNLSTIMRVLCGIGCPKALQGLRALLQPAWTRLSRVISALKDRVMRLATFHAGVTRPSSPG